MLAAALLVVLTITSMNVSYGYSNVTVTINYKLNGIQKIGVVLFGAEEIKDEIMKMIDGRFRIERVGMSSAVITFNVTDFGDYVYFPGAKLHEDVNATLTFPGNLSIRVADINEIPAAYIFK